MLVEKTRRKIEGRRTSYPPHLAGTRRFRSRDGARDGAAQKISRSGDTSTHSLHAQKIIGLYNVLHFEGGAAKTPHPALIAPR
jgi:hypothetical protein